jgi:hypothetical protein
MKIIEEYEKILYSKNYNVSTRKRKGTGDEASITLHMLDADDDE